MSRILGALLLLLSAGCGGNTLAGSPVTYTETAEFRTPVPTPGVTFIEVYPNHFRVQCPDVEVGDLTPRVQEECLQPRTGGPGQFGDHTTVEPTRRCRDGREATLFRGLGYGYVGEPLIAEGELAAAEIYVSCPSS